MMLVGCDNNYKFVEEAMKSGVRVDGRDCTQMRSVEILYNTSSYGHVEVSLGKSRVLCVVSSQVVKPFEDRPNEGLLTFNVDLGGGDSEEIVSLLDRLLKGSRAVDTETLCIMAGSQVWSIRVDIRELNDDGNMCDVSCLAAIAALLHYRRQDVSISHNSVTFHKTEEREPLPLCVHHMPVNISVGYLLLEEENRFAQEDATPVVVLDPTKVEENVITGRMCMAINQFGEVCGIHKPGGGALSRDSLHIISAMVTQTAQDIIEKLKQSLECDKLQRAEWRKNVHRMYAGEFLDASSYYKKRRKKIVESVISTKGKEEGWRGRKRPVQREDEKVTNRRQHEVCPSSCSTVIPITSVFETPTKQSKNQSSSDAPETVAATVSEECTITVPALEAPATPPTPTITTTTPSSVAVYGGEGKKSSGPRVPDTEGGNEMREGEEGMSLRSALKDKKKKTKSR
eukprot:GHVQ01010825.1.p1 GENE.GHVQ01010825.1~~GHVQ01010825.1.p1  ORF type:complete len:456 (+),score=79.87 GHVQ01010825.1:2797-4164(+)